MITLSQRLENIELLEKALLDEVPKRKARGVVFPLYECLRMLSATNELRWAIGKTSTTIEKINSAERQALGHADYGHKFALYCAFIVEED